MSALFEAVDLSTLASSVTTVLVAVVAVNMLFVGYKFVKKVLGKA